MDYTVNELRSGMYEIFQNGVRSFLFTGEDGALLVDSCFGGDLLSACRTITPQPITLITTHADPDHTGSDSQFETHYMHPSDFPLCADPSGFLPVNEGDCFVCGEYSLEVICIPGHTPGSIALLDRAHRFLISGDTVQAGCIFMFGENRSMADFYESVSRLEKMRLEGDFDLIYPSHADCVIPADVLPDHIALAGSILNGTSKPVSDSPDFLPQEVKIYRMGKAQMFYQPI